MQQDRTLRGSARILAVDWIQRLLPDLDDRSADALGSLSIVQTHPRGATLYSEAEMPTGIHILIEGVVQLIFIGQESSFRIFQHAAPGAFLGLAETIHEWPHSLTAVAEGRCRTLFVSAADFRWFLRNNRRAYYPLVQILSSFAHDGYQFIRSEILRRPTGQDFLH